MDTIRKDRATLPHWRHIRREFETIFEYEWWGRAWIIQEIVVGRIVVIQQGPHQVEWEALHKLLTYNPFFDDEFNEFFRSIVRRRCPRATNGRKSS